MLSRSRLAISIAALLVGASTLIGPTCANADTPTPTPTATASAPTPTATAVSDGLSDPTAAKLAAKCQTTIAKARASALASRLKALDGCGAKLSRCAQTKPGDQGCLDKAADACRKANDKLVAARAKLIAAIAKGCGALADADVLAAPGLAAETVSATCAQRTGTAVTNLASLGTCIADVVTCAAANAVEAQQPRLAQLLAAAGVDVDDGGCLDGLGGAGNVADAKLGKTVDACRAAVAKAGQKLVASRLKGTDACAGAVMKCLQEKPGDAACLTKARAKCDKAFGARAAAAQALRTGIAKKCAGISFGTLAAASGLNLAGLGAQCGAVGVPTVDTLDQYATCVERTHVCAADEAVAFAVPRVTDLLARANRTFGESFCPATGSDDPTIEMLLAAANAVAGGADDVPITADGSWRYLRTRSNGVVTGEELLHDGVAVISWMHAGNESNGAADSDGDGVVDRRWHVVRTDATTVTVIVTDDPGDDGTPTKRVTWSLANGVLHAVVEVGDGTSPVLVKIDEYDTTPIQQSDLGSGNPRDVGDCTPMQQQQVEALFKAAWEKGKNCFRQLGLDETLNFLTWKLVTDGISLTCDELPGDSCAEIDISDSLLRGALPVNVTVTVDPTDFFGNPICIANQQNVLWHEVLHVAHGPHSPGFTATNDPTYACTALCFNNEPTSNPKATKCQCATCLGTDPCDSRCAGYADCNPMQDCGLHVQIDTAVCETTPCSCGDTPGVYATQRATGQVSGPVGTYLQVNAPRGLAGEIDCGSWSVSDCPNPQNLLVCCHRETAGQAQTSTFDAHFPFPPPFMGVPQCACGQPLPGHNFVAQAIGVMQGVEDLETATPCQ